MKRFGIGCLLLLALLVGAVSGAAVLYFADKRSRTEREAYRLDGSPPLRPAFLRDAKTCRERNSEERRLDDAMLLAGQRAASPSLAKESPVHRYVVSYFAWHWRQAGAGTDACPPDEDLIVRLAPLLDRNGWPHANTELNDLRLVEQLPANAIRARGLAEIAFLGWIPPSALKGADSRPYARQLLADQGEFAKPWSGRALRELGGDSRLDTSAAYLAVATDPAAALPQVERTMRDKLERSRERKTRAYRTGGEVEVLRDDDGNRLIELGYALARAGAAAEPYSAPVIAMLDEQIARASPPFGLMAARPTEFCRIARHIGGRAASAADAKPFCAPNFRGGDGAPRDF